MKRLIVFYWAGLFFLFEMNYAFAESEVGINTTSIMTAPPRFNLTIATINKCSLRAIWGTPAPKFRLALGMWSVHTSDNKTRNGQNDLLGFSYKSYFVGTLVNSYYKRAYAVGIQRYWLMNPFYKDIHYELGYRLGLVSGYKGYNVTGFKALKNSNIIPFVQIVFGLNYKHIGWEVSTPNLSVISTSFYIRF